MCRFTESPGCNLGRRHASRVSVMFQADISLTPTTHLNIVANMAITFTIRSGFFKQDNVSCNSIKNNKKWLEELDKDHYVLPNPRDLNIIEYLWSVLDKLIRSMEAPVHTFQNLKNLLLMSCCQRWHQSCTYIYKYISISICTVPSSNRQTALSACRNIKFYHQINRASHTVVLLDILCILVSLQGEE